MVPAMAQRNKERAYKNVIRYNLTGSVLFGTRYIVLGYERVLFPHQSFSVNIGRPALPGISIVDGDGYHVSKDHTDNGYNFSMDYRFYLAGENKFQAPRGVYVGPYYSFNYFTRRNNWTINTQLYDGQLRSDMSLMINVIGVELGYQFIIAKRIALDFVMIGPGLGLYDFNMTVAGDGQVDPEVKDAIRTRLGDALDQRFNGLEKTFSSKGFRDTDNFSNLGAGYRFIIHLGFNF